MRIFKYIKYKKLFIIGFIAKTLEVVLELFLPIFMAILMKEGLKEGNTSRAYQMVGLILLFATLGYLSTVFAHRLAAKVSQDFAKNVRQAVFYKVQDLSIEDINVFSSSSLINRLNLDVSNLQNGLAMVMRIASRAPVLMIGSIISLFIVSKDVALVLVIGLPIAIGILSIIIYASMRMFRRFQKQNDKLLDVVKDNIEGSRMIRAFAQVEHEEERFRDKNIVLTKIMNLLGKITALSSPFTTLALNVILIAMVYISSFKINAGNMSQEQLNQVITYSTQLSLSLISIMNLILLYTKAHSSAIRINEILDKESSIKNQGIMELSNKPAKIEFRNVNFSYKDNKSETLKNINLVIKPGETIGVVGLTGSGKTTFVDLLLRLFDVKSGEILINDINIKEYNIDSLRNNISYASQKAALLSGDIKDNVMMSNGYEDKKIIEALEQANANFALTSDDGIDGLVLKQGINFSGGQRQRLALARALVKDSAILILDDIFSALDYITDVNIRRAINKRDKKQTTVFISQRLSSLSNANRIIVLDQGMIINIGTHEQLLEESELYRRIYETQIVEVQNV